MFVLDIRMVTPSVSLIMGQSLKPSSNPLPSSQLTQGYYVGLPRPKPFKKNQILGAEVLRSLVQSSQARQHLLASKHLLVPVP